MNLSEVFIRRPVMTVALTVSVVLFGLLAYFRLPVSDLPAVDYPVIQVQVSYPGATPDTMANNVATPLERQFMQIPGLELVTSNNGQGHSSFVLQFDLSKSLDGAATDVQAAITRAQGQLPVDLPSPPTFTKTNPNDQPIQYIALVSDTVTEGQLYDYANTQVGERLSILPGVSQVAIYGTQSAVRIKADPPAMAIRNITLEDLTGAIKNGTAYTGAGQFDGPQRSFLLQPQGQLITADEYNGLIVGQTNGAPVYLKDVASAREGVQDERIDMRLWVRGYPQPGATVVVAVFRRAGANAVEVSKSVRDLLPTIQTQLPTSVLLVPAYDRSLTIVGSIKDVQATLYIAFVLVVMVIFVFLGRVTDTLIPAVALPLSLLLTFIAMDVLGYSLDNLSLMALTLAIGFLVDDAIVFLENTVRLMESGQNAFEASLNWAREITFPIPAMTLSLAAVFIPLVFMSGLMGRIFREFSLTIVISILASGIVSLTQTPLMTSRLLSNRGEGAKKTWMERAFGAFEHRVLDVYGRSLWFFLRHRWISALTWAVCLAGTVYLFYVVPKSFLPVGDSSFIRGILVAQEGSSPDQMHAYQTAAEKIMKANPAVRSTFTMSGNASFMGSNQAFLIAFLKDPSQRPPIAQVAGQLMGAIANSVPGAVAFLQPNPALEISTGATANAQNYSYLIKKPTDQYQVILEVADEKRAAPEDLSKLYIKSDDGQRMVPLNAVTSWHPAIGPQAVNHINQFTSVTMFFNLKPGYAIGPATQFVEGTAKQILPPSIVGALQGEALTFRNTVSDLAVLMLVAVFVMYVILAILYESYLHPNPVLSSLPVALLGGLATLWLFGAEASLYAYIGMFMLMGIVKKNGIMIVDFAAQRVRQGIADTQAIHDASMERFRPIMMTTAAALLGAMPIALGYGADGSSRRPLGLVVVGGLIVSQFITLFVTPAIYLYLEEFQQKVLDRFSFFRSPREHAPEPSFALQEGHGD